MIAPVQGYSVLLGSEENSTPVAGLNDTVLNTTNRHYHYFSLSTTAALYLATGFEVLNGTVVNGDWQGGLELVNANPPSSNNTVLVGWTARVAQSGASAVQRTSLISTSLIPGGTLLGAWVVSNSATGRYGTTTVASANRLRAIALGNDPSLAAVNSFAGGTEEAYIKVYFKPVLAG